MINLHDFQLPMGPIPERMKAAIRRGILKGEFPDREHAATLFARWPTHADRMIRSHDGCLLVTCTTEMPGVSAQMIDWWFGWHLPFTERYRLWHPLAHRRAKVKEDRQHIQCDRDRYLGNVSYVDEFIGNRLMRLAISFFPPADIGLHEAYAPGTTAICAHTADRMLGGEGGTLVHLVVPTTSGSEMRSAFWLGQIGLKWPLVGNLLRPMLNAPSMRKLIVSDRMATDLLQHCAEEMNHLPRFLPSLFVKNNSYPDFNSSNPQGPYTSTRQE